MESSLIFYDQHQVVHKNLVSVTIQTVKGFVTSKFYLLLRTLEKSQGLD